MQIDLANTWASAESRCLACDGSLNAYSVKTWYSISKNPSCGKDYSTFIETIPHLKAD